MFVTDHVADNIRLALLMLVPLAITELAGLSFETRQKIAEEAGDLISGKADQLMYASSQEPGVLGPMARGFAALAYQPGGVTALGLHACVLPHPGCPAITRRPSCCSCDGDVCAWCTNGCPAAGTEDPCCTSNPPFGRICEVK